MKNKFTILSTTFLLSLANLSGAQCFKKISTLFESNIALDVDGTIWEWGNNNAAQLGLGTYNYEHKNTPFQLGTANDWKDVISSFRSTMAQKNDGSIWAWGHGPTGQFANVPTDNLGYIYVPTLIGVPPYNRVFNTYVNSYGIKSDGSIWAWGNNADGQVGNGGVDINGISVPTQIGTDNNWHSVVGGVYYIIALKNNGTLWAWGANGGLFGNGTTQDSHTPTQIGTDNDWKEISTNINHTLALKTNGTLWGWGYNEFGQIGDGTTVNRLVPVQIGSENNWRQAEASQENSFAIKNDGSLWAWGKNTGGLLADGTSQMRISPIRIGTSNDWKDIQCGVGHCVARKQDNSVWTWGYNLYGQLGNGNFTDNFTPTMIIGPCSLLSTENNILLSQNLKIFPNPVSENLNFSKEIINIKIYSLDGKLVKDIENIKSSKINLSPIDAGIYFIEAITTDGKIIKEEIIKN